MASQKANAQKKKRAPARITPPNARQAKAQAVASSGGPRVNPVIVAAVVAIVVIVAIVGGVVWSQGRADDADGGRSTTLTLPRGVTESGAGYVAFADVTPAPGAPTLEVYEDFQCPACALYEKAIGSTIRDLAKQGKVRLVYHVKNFLDDSLGNDSSTRAGTAAFCAADAGRFQEFHDLLFANQPAREGDGFTDAQLRRLADQAGINGSALSTWETCSDSGRYDAYVDSVEDRSGRDGVQGTPTVRLDGEDITQQAGTPEQLIAAVERADS
ncbi:MAG: DsbA family protein [Dermatophilaceae bacterium]